MKFDHVKSLHDRMTSIPVLNDAEARELAYGRPTEASLLVAVVASIWTSAIGGSNGIAQAFESFDPDHVPRTDAKLKRIARRLRKLGYHVTTGPGAFIDIEWE